MQILKDGPIIIEGPLLLKDAKGNEVASHGGNVALCRCGHSANKPYCDGEHKAVGFKCESYTVNVIGK